MAGTEIEVDGFLLDNLSEEFGSEDAEAQARLRETYAALSAGGCFPYLVATVQGVKIKIWADEHPPPHFHVEYQGEGASFSIVTCERLAGDTGLKKHEKIIRRWWKTNWPILVETWNSTRPAGCPVGPIRLVVCIDNSGYAAVRGARRIFIAQPDATAEEQGQLRIVDESGVELLRPKSLFRPFALPEELKRTILSVA